MNISFNNITSTLSQILFIAFLAYCIDSFLYLNLQKQPLPKKQTSNSIEYIYYSLNNALKPPVQEKPKEKPKVQILEVDKTPHNDISIFELRAAFSVDDKTGWVVIEVVGSKRSKTLKIGQGYRNYILKKVFSKYAVFERRGKMYSLYLQKNDKHSQYTMDTQALYKDKIKVLDDKIKVKQTFVQKYIKNSNDIWREIAINENRIDGKIEGFLITGISYNSVFKRLGLKKGDILISVNNQKLNSYSDALRVYKKVKSQKNIHLVINRNGEIKEIDYELF